MKEKVKLEDRGEKLTDDWFSSLERQEALRDWSRKPDEKGEDKFEHSKEFANARHAFRKRINS